MPTYSRFNKMGEVKFPHPFEQEKTYMIPFTDTLPPELARWVPTVNMMLKGIPEVSGEKYLTIDSSPVYKGKKHRRGGKHIDGNWVYTPMRLEQECCEMGWSTQPSRGWSTSSPTYRPDRWDNLQGGIILASNNIGCIAYDGYFEESVGEMGSCEHFKVNPDNQVAALCQPYVAYWGNMSMVHETIPSMDTMNRQFVRIILPADHGWGRMT